jgi:hypothetical protein
MSQAIKIDSRFATAQETAHILGVPSSRAQQLVRLVEEKESANERKRDRKASKASSLLGSKAHSIRGSKSKASHASRKKSTRIKASKAAR